MIGKIVIGKSFGGCVRYVVQKEKAEVLYGEGIRLENTSQMTRDFNMQRLLKPGLGQAVAHISLNFSEQDKAKLTNEVMLNMAKEYLKMMNIKDTQVLIVRHNDADHPHCHIVYNRVDNNGKTISDQFQFKKNVAVCRDMTLRHGLHISTGKSKVNRLALKGADQKKYQMYDIIKAASITAKNWKQFEKQLDKKGIALQFKYAGQTKNIQGVSFKMGEYSFKGSEIDRSFSFGRLDKTFETNVKLDQAIKYEQKSIEQSRSLADELRAAIGHKGHEESLLDILFSPQIDIAPDPEPFWIKKKKKGQGQDQSHGISR